MDNIKVLKAIADETRLKILVLLLKQNYCVRALARELKLSEATTSQHLKILRKADLLVGEKRGYFMHYEVKRITLHKLSTEIGALANIEREIVIEQSATTREENCPHQGQCGESTREICHGKNDIEGDDLCEHCDGHKS